MFANPLDYRRHAQYAAGSGFVSFRRSPRLALEIVVDRRVAWRYAALVVGGLDFEVLRRSTRGDCFDENEVAAPGGVGWEAVVAYRALQGDDVETIFVRRDFARVDPSADRRVRQRMAFAR